MSIFWFLRAQLIFIVINIYSADHHWWALKVLSIDPIKLIFLPALSISIFHIAENFLKDLSSSSNYMEGFDLKKVAI
jgi:hypothetical protein